MCRLAGVYNAFRHTYNSSLSEQELVLSGKIYFKVGLYLYRNS